MTWLVAGAALFATWLNIHKVRACFAVWFVTNSTWAVYDFAASNPARGIQMTIYAGLSVVGWRKWR